MLSKQALETIAAVFGDETLRLPPGLWRAGVEIQDWAAAQLALPKVDPPKEPNPHG